jgi:hypothetical protein
MSLSILCGGLSDATSLTLIWSASSLAFDRVSGRLIVGVAIVVERGRNEA